MTATTCGSPLKSIGTSNVPAIASLSSSNCQSSVRRRALTRVLPSCWPNTENSATSRSAPANTPLQSPPLALPPLVPEPRDNASQSSTLSNGRLPFSVTPRSARNSASAPPNCERRTAELERPNVAGGRRIEIHGEAARRAQVAVHGETADGERHGELEVRRLAGRLCERLRKTQRDAR